MTKKHQTILSERFIQINHFALSSFLVVKLARIRSNAEIDISIEQSTVCFAVSQSICNVNKHQTFCLRQHRVTAGSDFGQKKMSDPILGSNSYNCIRSKIEH